MYGVIGKTGARCPDLAAMAVEVEQEAYSMLKGQTNSPG
jgi:hypothetical protein